MTSVNLGGASYRLVRALRRSSNLIKVYKGNSGERLLTLDIHGKQGPPPSQWIFEQMGIDKFFAAHVSAETAALPETRDGVTSLSCY